MSRPLRGAWTRAERALHICRAGAVGSDRARATSQTLVDAALLVVVAAAGSGCRCDLRRGGGDRVGRGRDLDDVPDTAEAADAIAGRVAWCTVAGETVQRCAVLGDLQATVRGNGSQARDARTA